MTFLKDIILKYIKQDCNLEIIKSILKRITLQFLTLIPLIDENKSTAIPFWEIIYYLQLKDSSNKVVSE